MNRTLVFSYPRSGTHWFCSLLKGWFYPDVDLGGDLDVSEHLPWTGWEGTEQQIPWAGLLGGHYYDPRLRTTVERLGQCRPIYLIRDGRDVMISIWRMDQYIARQQGNPTIDFSIYMRQALHIPSSYPIKNMIPRMEGGMPTAVLWWWSTRLWLENASVIVVQYEDLLRDLEGQKKHIAKCLGFDDALELPQHQALPVGLYASDNPRSGRWKDVFTSEDIRFWLWAKDKAGEFA